MTRSTLPVAAAIVAALFVAGCGAHVLPVSDAALPAAVRVAAPAPVDVALDRPAPAPTTTVAPTATAAPTTTQAPAPTTTAAPPPARNEFAPVTSPDVGDHCIDNLEPGTLNEFWSSQIGSFGGSDYQRSFHLGDGRILWTFQDAFIGGRLIHNAAFVQSGRCFTMLSANNWLFANETSNRQSWYWIFDGGIAADGTFHLFVTNMVEHGGHYLANSTPTRMFRVVLDVDTLTVIDTVEEPIHGVDLYGWSVTSDAEHTYLLSHCYRQFGHGDFGFDASCSADTKVARVPLGEFAAERDYWDGAGWGSDPTAAASITSDWLLQNTGDFGNVPSNNNPVQVRFDGDKFRLVSNPGDWWSDLVQTASADSITGPWTIDSEYQMTPKCDATQIAGGCNTYYASWVPWLDAAGDRMFAIGNNTWDGSQTHNHLWVYRPSVHSAATNVAAPN